MDSDTASLSDIDPLGGRVKAEFGTLDMLFVNAGVLQKARPAVTGAAGGRVMRVLAG